MSTSSDVLSECKQIHAPADCRIPLLDLRARPTHERVIAKIENVVATTDLGQRLDLDAILKMTPGAKYNPQTFPGLVYKLKKPRTTTLLFGTGKMVCTGAKSTKSAKTAIAHIIKELKSQGIIIFTNPDTEIENIVASCDLHGTIDLEMVTERLCKTMYEPEQFPGLIYTMTEPKSVLLVFASGRIVCVGAKTEADMHLAIEKLRETLELNQLISRTESLPRIQETVSELKPYV